MRLNNFTAATSSSSSSPLIVQRTESERAHGHVEEMLLLRNTESARWRARLTERMRAQTEAASSSTLNYSAGVLLSAKTAEAKLKRSVDSVVAFYFNSQYQVEEPIAAYDASLPIARAATACCCDNSRLLNTSKH